MQQRLDISDAGIALTKSFEGLRLTAYRDVAGILTVGYGHVCSYTKPGETITEAEAEKLLRFDMQACVDCVNEHVTRQLAQHEFDALVDFCYNAGRGAFEGSTLLRKVNANDPTAADEFVRWDHVGGVEVAGLKRRREAEAAMYRGEPAH